MSEIKLKPCPFCLGGGAIGKHRNNYFVECCKCGARTWFYSSPEKAAETWNRRRTEGDLISRKSVLELMECNKNNNLIILYDKVKELPTICNMNSIEDYLKRLNDFKIEINKKGYDSVNMDAFLHFIDKMIKRIKKEFINLRYENEK